MVVLPAWGVSEPLLFFVCPMVEVVPANRNAISVATSNRGVFNAMCCFIKFLARDGDSDGDSGRGSGLGLLGIGGEAW